MRCAAGPLTETSSNNILLLRILTRRQFIIKAEFAIAVIAVKLSISSAFGFEFRQGIRLSLFGLRGLGAVLGIECVKCAIIQIHHAVQRIGAGFRRVEGDNRAIGETCTFAE